MIEKTVTITLDEYRELVQIAERIAALSRLIEKNSFITIEEVKGVLDITVETKSLEITGE